MDWDPDFDLLYLMHNPKTGGRELRDDVLKYPSNSVRQCRSLPNTMGALREVHAFNGEDHDESWEKVFVRQAAELLSPADPTHVSARTRRDVETQCNLIEFEGSASTRHSLQVCAARGSQGIGLRQRFGLRIGLGLEARARDS